MASVQVLGPAFSNFVRSVMLACHEKGIDFQQCVEYQGQQCMPGTAALEALNPFGKVPVLVHGDLVLFETSSILRYLDHEFAGPELQPADSHLRAQVDQWCSAFASQVDQAIVRSYLLEIVMPLLQGGEVNRQRVADAEPGVARMLAIIEHQLRDDGYIIGDHFTLADALAAPMLDYLVGQPAARTMVADAPRVLAYVERVKARPSGREVLVVPEFLHN